MIFSDLGYNYLKNSLKLIDAGYEAENLVIYTLSSISEVWEPIASDNNQPDQAQSSKN